MRRCRHKIGVPDGLGRYVLLQCSWEEGHYGPYSPHYHWRPGGHAIDRIEWYQKKDEERFAAQVARAVEEGQRRAMEATRRYIEAVERKHGKAARR